VGQLSCQGINLNAIHIIYLKKNEKMEEILERERKFVVRESEYCSNLVRKSRFGDETNV
jgi:hypothetical protein